MTGPAGFGRWRAAWAQDRRVWPLLWPMAGFFAGFWLGAAAAGAAFGRADTLLAQQGTASLAYAAGLALFFVARGALRPAPPPVLCAPGATLRWSEAGLGFLAMAGLSAALWFGLEAIGLSPVRRFAFEPGLVWLALGVLAAGFGFAALAEEIVFRGHLLPALAGRTSLAVAAGASALLFTAIHFRSSLETFAGTLMLGVVLAVAVWRTGSIVAATAGHLAYNLALVFLRPDLDANPPAVNLAALFALYALWLAAIWRFGRRARTWGQDS